MGDAKELGDMGFMGIIFPEEYGGSGFPTMVYAIVVEEISAFDPSVGLSVAAHNGLCTNHIYLLQMRSRRKNICRTLPPEGKWVHGD